MSAGVLAEGGRRTIRLHTRFLGSASERSSRTLLCPARGSSNVAQMLGDNGGVSYVCTACGHSWS
ncbi:hypothetical protein [Streptomyces daqingensis]|uniref:hypothetical protein n=1 Tax=Streptomyces daqingensis TaxID=1472640 RepID=UPI001E345ACE|nr:hypothetical protein [Streptomyces daqingensis]